MSANEKKQPGQGFEALLGELDTMTKALPAADVADDDNKIKAAAGAEDDDKPKLDADGKPIVAEPMAKSFKVTLDDGTEVEAEDGTELVKSLMQRFDTNEDQMVKALGGTLNLVKAQGEQLASLNVLCKALQADLAKLGNQGAGRKTMLNVHEQITTLAKSSQPTGPTPQEFMVKANAAFDAKKISGIELTTCDVAIRQKEQIDPGLIAKVLA